MDAATVLIEKREEEKEQKPKEEEEFHRFNRNGMKRNKIKGLCILD